MIVACFNSAACGLKAASTSTPGAAGSLKLPESRPVCWMNFFWSALMDVSMLTVALRGVLSETYVRRLCGMVVTAHTVRFRHRDEEAEREHLRRTCLADGAMFDMIRDVGVRLMASLWHWSLRSLNMINADTSSVNPRVTCVLRIPRLVGMTKRLKYSNSMNETYRRNVRTLHVIRYLMEPMTVESSVGGLPSQASMSSHIVFVRATLRCHRSG
jgi:hypothetical protein